MEQYGYISPASSVRDVAAATKKVQKLLGLRPTGKLTPQVHKAMIWTPRCGCSDVQRVRGGLNKWGMVDLTYFINSYLTGLPKTTQDDIFEESWKAWERVCGIRVKPTRNKRTTNIVIDSSSNPREEFGTVGNVLAWAFLPQGPNHTAQLATKYDNAETWLADFDRNRRGIILLHVATHENGHLLGLDHTQINGELMFPTYSELIGTPQSRYDVPQSVRRYDETGEGNTPPPTQPPGNDDVRIYGTINGKPYRLVPA